MHKSIVAERARWAHVPGICAFLNLRKASRVVGRLFDNTLAPCGLKATQLSVLVLTLISGEPTVTNLARLLMMDQSTLTRNVRPLLRRGFIRITSGVDRRTRVITLTAKGVHVVSSAFPYWEQAQDHVTTKLGDERWTRMLRDLASSASLTSSYVL